MEESLRTEGVSLDAIALVRACEATEQDRQAQRRARADLCALMREGSATGPMTCGGRAIRP